MNLPAEFLQKMQKRLGAAYPAFLRSYEDAPVRGVRANLLKLTAAEFAALAPFAREPVPWAEGGFYTDAEKPGHTAAHHAGLFYAQEPSAMCAAPLLNVKPGERVLDLCAAPGGKTTQLAAAMRGEGVLVANEYVYDRARILSQNVERLGVKNAAVLNESPARLAAFFGEYFDKILVDAPCSGEGMFRKNAEEALGEWSEENVAKCAARQKEILGEAAKMLRPGGRLVYSTCTFSEEEDEEQAANFLRAHSDFRLSGQKKLYPHKTEGEGHFAAVFERLPAADCAAGTARELKPRISRSGETLYRAFEREFLNVSLTRLHEAGGMLYALPEGMFDWKDLHVLRAGIRLGELKNGRFEPSHSLAMCLKKEEFVSAEDFAPDDGRTEKFLHGETVEADGRESGWCGVCVGGFPVGWGKAVGGIVKNHIPKGLRKF